MGTGVLVSPFVKIPKGSDRIAGLRAAASAALKALAESGKSTVLFEDTSSADEQSGDPQLDQQASVVSVAGSHDQETVAAGEASLNAEETGRAQQIKVEGSPRARGTNPLAAFLGSYSDDESTGPDEVALESSSDAIDPKQPADMDDELSKFMQELESSGLLEDSQTQEETQALLEPPVVTTSAAHADDPPGKEDTPQAAVEGAAAAENDPSEQRTLGKLAAAPEWYKVLDTGSGREYFWNVVSNDVLWEPPEGVDSSVLLPVDSTAEALTEAEAGVDDSSCGGTAGDAAAVASAAAHDETAAASEATQDDNTLTTSVVEQQAGGQFCSSIPSSTKLLASAGGALASCEDVPEQSLTLRSCDIDAAAAEEPAQVSRAAPALHASITLRQPQQDVQPVFNTLLLELQSVAQVTQQVQQLPAAARLLLQLQVLHEQWLLFAPQQQAAAAAAAAGQHVEGAQPFSWLDYEHYVMQQLQQAAQQLQSTLHAVKVPGNAAGDATGDVVQGVVEQQHCEVAADQQQDVVSPKPAPEPEEGEVCPSPLSSCSSGDADDMEVDMDLEVDSGPKASSTQGPDAAALWQQQQQQQLASVVAAQAVPAQRDRHGSPAGGMYASTLHMPRWARPDHHYSFAGGHHPAATAGFHAAQPGFTVGYDYGLTAHPSYMSYGHVYSAAAAGEDAAAAAAALGSPPPLPADDPPPLPDDDPPQVVQEAHSDQVAPVACGDAVTPALPPVTARPVKRQKVVAAPAVRKAVAVADAALAAPAGADSGGLSLPDPAGLTAGLLITDGKEGRKRAHDQQPGGSGGGVNAVLAASAAGPSSKARSGKVGALLNKWASVRQQQQEEEEQRQRQLEKEANPEYLEAKRVRELEQWSRQQMAAGAEDNPNFTPVSGDWRARLGLSSEQKPGAGAAGAAETPEERAARKVARRAAKAAKKAAAGSKSTGERSQWPTSMKVEPDVAALSVGLPPGWVAMYEQDEVTGLYNIYYGNPETKETSWDRP